MAWSLAVLDPVRFAASLQGLAEVASTLRAREGADSGEARSGKIIVPPEGPGGGLPHHHTQQQQQLNRSTHQDERELRQWMQALMYAEGASMPIRLDRELEGAAAAAWMQSTTGTTTGTGTGTGTGTASKRSVGGITREIVEICYQLGGLDVRPKARLMDGRLTVEVACRELGAAKGKGAVKVAVEVLGMGSVASNVDPIPSSTPISTHGLHLLGGAYAKQRLLESMGWVVVGVPVGEWVAHSREEHVTYLAVRLQAAGLPIEEEAVRRAVRAWGRTRDDRQGGADGVDAANDEVEEDEELGADMETMMESDLR